MAQIPFVDPNYFNPFAKVQEGISQGMGLARYLRENRQLDRQERKQKELEAAYTEFQESKKSAPAAPEKPTPTQGYVGRGMYEEMAGVQGDIERDAAIQGSLADQKANTEYQARLETIKSYPLERRAEYLNKLKDIFNKYGEPEKADQVDNNFMQTIKVLSGFSPKAAANVWNKSYPNMAITPKDIKGLAKWKTFIYGPNRDGILQSDEDGNIVIVQEASAKGETPLRKLEYINSPDGAQRIPIEMKPGYDFKKDYPGWRTDKEIELETNKNKEKTREKERTEDVNFREKRAEAQDTRSDRSYQQRERFHKETASGTAGSPKIGSAEEKIKLRWLEVGYEGLNSKEKTLWNALKKEDRQDMKTAASILRGDPSYMGATTKEDKERIFKETIEMVKRSSGNPSQGGAEKTPALSPGHGQGAIEQRKPGESIADYMKRTGKK